MTVVVNIQNQLNPEIVEGDLVTLANALNLTAAQGKQFALFDSPSGPVMVQTRLITSAREGDASAFVSGD